MAANKARAKEDTCQRSLTERATPLAAKRTVICVAYPTVLAVSRGITLPLNRLIEKSVDEEL